MLPLHTKFKSLPFASLFFIVLSSCINNSKKDILVIETLNETIESSSQMVAASIKEIMLSLDMKLRDPASSERTAILYPKAIKIQQISVDIINYIESIKKSLNSESSFSSELFEKLLKYKNDILLVDSRIAREIQQSVRVFTKAIDSSGANQKILFQNYFDNASSQSVLAMLNKLKNNVLVNEERMVTFCHESMAIDYVIRDLNAFWPFVTQSSSVVMPGENIDVSAGVGTFNTNAQPEVFVYNNRVLTRENGVVVYKLKASTKPGKYYVPIKIVYTDQDGKNQIIQKEIEYTVTNIQKQ